jgi:ankyrin repeat protein
VKQFLDLAKGIVDINSHDTNGKTALCVAARHGDLAMVKLLMSHKASVHSTSRSGKLPVHCAAKLAASAQADECEAGYTILRHLKAAGANLYAVDRSNQTAYEIGRLQENLQPPAIRPAAQPMFSAVRTMPELPSQSGMFAEKSLNQELYNAVKFGNVKEVAYYLEMGVNPDYKYADTDHVTLINYLILHTRLELPQIQILTLLLEHQADAAIPDRQHNTAIELILIKQECTESTRELVTNILLDTHRPEKSRRVDDGI